MSPLPRLAVEHLEDRLAPAASEPDPGLQFLAAMHDEFHTRLDVSTDVSSAGNHFVAVGFLPDENAPVAVNGSSTASPHAGATAIRNTFRIEAGKPFGGAYFMNGLLTPEGQTTTNFGETAGAGYLIPSPTRITFWARGQVGGERLEFFAFGVGRHADTGVPFGNTVMPDSSVRIPGLGVVTTLTADWRQYAIDIPAGTNTSYVLGGFAWTAEAARNPAGVVFDLDDIVYELSPAGQAARLAEPRFVRSYRTGPYQDLPGTRVKDFDFVLRNSAFSYDNALAALAFLADRDPATRGDSLRRARLIGDTFVYAAAHDRTYTDGRIRTDYAAGDYRLFPGWKANDRLDTAPVAGFYDEVRKVGPEPAFYEVEQEAVDTGNNAWVMVALLGLHSRTGHGPYLDAARRVGDFIRTQRYDDGLFPGFRGGIMDPEKTAVRREYASTEHNLDITAAFTRMFEITGEPVWRDDAAHAWRFVESMWDAGRGVFLAGTSDPNTRNTTAGQLPLDVQAWAVLVRPAVLATRPELLAGIDTFFRTTEAGITGYDFNEDKDGVWSEGTAQVATAFAVAGLVDRAADLRGQLERIRATRIAPGADGLGLPAALRDGLTTGFQTPRGDDFEYHNRLHTGATAWGVFARLGFNPYYQTYTTDPLAVGGTPAGTAGVLVETVAGHFYDAPVGAVAPFGSLSVAVRTAVGDVNGDRVPDTVLVTGPGVPIRVAVVSGRDNSAVLVAPFDPFGGDFLGGGFVAAGDLDNDGTDEFMVTPDEGGGPRVTVFSRNADGTTTVRANFFGIDDANFRGGARIAAGDVNRDGTPDVVVAAGFGGGPRTAIFTGQSVLAGAPARLVNDFFAFPGTDATNLRNGVFVAAGDVDGDGNADLIFGGGPGGAPRVFILSGALVSAGDVNAAQANPIANFFVAGNANDRGGARVAAKDADGDARADVAVGSGEGSPAKVRVYLGANFGGGGEPGAFQDIAVFGGAALPGGVFVG